MAIKTTTNKKPTKNERYTQISALLTRCVEAGLLTEAERKDLSDFVAHEQELLTRKSTSKSGEKKLTPRQQENEALRENILDLLSTSENPMTITDFLNALPKTEDMTPNRVTALLSQLIKAGQVERSKNKGKTLFALAKTETEEVDPETSDEG